MAPGPDGASRVPVVHLYGRLEGGGAFLVRDDRQRPHFYVRASDARRAAAGRALALAPVDRRTFDGAPVCRVEVEVPSDVPPLRDELHAAGIETFEADVRFASRYLIERGIKGGCEIDGTPAAGERRTRGGIPQPRAAPRRGDDRAPRAFLRYRDRCQERAAARDLAVFDRRGRGADRGRQRPADARARHLLRRRARRARGFRRARRRARSRRAHRLEHRRLRFERARAGSRRA